MLQDIMQDSFIVRLSQATRHLNFSVLVHTEDNGVTVSINKGEISETVLPGNLLPYINNDQEYCSYFSHGDSLVVLYFLRFRIDNVKYTVVVQDNKKRFRLNKFVATLMEALNEPVKIPGDDFEVAEQEGVISFMDMRIKELEKTIRERNDALSEKEKELSVLNADVRRLENSLEQQEQDAILDMTILAQEKRELESKLDALEEQARRKEAQKTQELPEYEMQLFRDTAAQEKVDGLHAALENAKTELESLQGEFESVQREAAFLHEKVDSRDAEIKIHKEIAISKDEEIQSLKLDLRLMQNQQDLAKIGDSDIDKEFVAAKEQVAKLEAENDTLRLKLKQMHEESITKEESNEQFRQMARLEADKQELEAQLSRADGTIGELKESILDTSSSSISKAEHETLMSSLRASYEMLQARYEAQSVQLAEQERMFVSREEYNKALEEVERWKKVRARMQKEQDDLRDAVDKVHAERAELNDAYKALYEEMEHRSREVVNKEKLVTDLRQSMKEQLKQQNDLRRHTDSLSELNDILRKNRDKLNDLINGLSQPILTVNDDMKIMTSNRALVVFSGSENSVDMVGCVCHQRVYRNSKPCSWCMLKKVKSTGEPERVNVVQGEEGHARHLDVTFFPIFDSDHTLIEVGEFILDKTEVVELTASINKFKEKMREVKKSRIEDMNEISEVKKAYEDLTAEHEKVVERNSKMLKVIERLVSEDKARELLSVRTELMEVRNKLYRSSEMIKNYKYQLDEQLLRYSDLNKRTFLQMERLLNIMKNKNQLRSEETMSILTFLTREFEVVKRHFIEKAKKESPKPVTDGRQKALTVEKTAESGVHTGNVPDNRVGGAPATEFHRVDVVEKTKEFQSEEERMLYEKLSAAAQKVMNQEKKR